MTSGPSLNPIRLIFVSFASFCSNSLFCLCHTPELVDRHPRKQGISSDIRTIPEPNPIPLRFLCSLLFIFFCFAYVKNEMRSVAARNFS